MLIFMRLVIFSFLSVCSVVIVFVVGFFLRSICLIMWVVSFISVMSVVILVFIGRMLFGMLLCIVEIGRRG